MDEKEMIERVTVIYREGLKDLENIKTKMRELKKKLKDPTTTHYEYIRAERQLKALDGDHTVQLYMTQGISMAREILFDCQQENKNKAVIENGKEKN